MKDFLFISPSVQEAIENKKPVLALESTIISHGMPYPENVNTTHLLVKTCKDKGVVPAIVAISEGSIQIGLDEKTIEQLAKSEDVVKVSRRNLAWALFRKKLGSTTVSATMIAAKYAGIKVFATGGIGGVHRNFDINLDISQDLLEFTKSPVIVVCAGAKAILDVPKTIELLETLGVAVFGFKTNTFPLFYSCSSDIPVEKVHSAKDVASIFGQLQKMSKNSGMLIANPIPKKHEIPNEKIESFIEKALKQAEKHGVKGLEVTPFLLTKLEQITKGESLICNTHLIKNNVEIGCDIAIEVAKRARER